MFTLNTNLIPNLNRNMISFRYIGGVYNTKTIIVTYKTLDVCRVDINRDPNKPYNYDVYWFGVFSGIYWLRRWYGISEDLVADIKKAIESLSDEQRYIISGRGNGKTSGRYPWDWRNEYQKERDKFDIKDVIFNDPATIVLWADGTKTVVKAENEPFDPEKGLAMAISKRSLGDNYGYYDTFKKYVGRYEKKQKKG